MRPFHNKNMYNNNRKDETHLAVKIYILREIKIMRFFTRRNNTTKTSERTERNNTMKKHDNNICELVFILDRSGSMGGLENDTIGGFNSLIEKQKKQNGKCYVTTVLFDNISEVIHDRVELSEISPMTEKEYYVRGATALLDATGEAVEHISTVHKYIRPEDVPSKTLFVITTDGMENSSTKYSADKVKKLIKEKQEKDGWEFLFLGANIDAVSAASNIGINADRAVRYHSDSTGTAKNYEAVSEFACAMRTTPLGAARLDDSWKKDIEEDFKKRCNK